MKVYILMESANPVGAYTDNDLAQADCYKCNDAQRYLDMEQFTYWVKELEVIEGQEQPQTTLQEESNT